MGGGSREAREHTRTGGGRAWYGTRETPAPLANPKSRPLENSTPTFLVDTFYLGVGFLERYGWLIVIGLVILVFLWSKLKPYWKELQNKWERQQEIANFDPIKAASQQERMEDARRRLQEKQDAKAAKFMEDQRVVSTMVKHVKV
ncbi:selenoprotein S-like [Stylophora pistillata]|uniref:selenoprotein S-like n=1 Tax=Stylophora pistillata TaxID=50429 RepID=UPI000C038CC4|nr:selenoprotein S-like [Stylophora pistillata]